MRKYIDYLKERFRDFGAICLGYFIGSSYVDYMHIKNAHPYNPYEGVLYGIMITFGATLLRYIQDRYFPDKSE